jgi:hypothetical protein
MFQLPQFIPPNRKHTVPRRKFTHEEDLRLRSLVEQIGTKSWEAVSKFMPNRTARQCRDRYKNYLLDSLICEAWAPEEDTIIIEKFREIGPKWVEIAKYLNGRSGNHVKNRWHKHLSKITGILGVRGAPVHFPPPPVVPPPPRIYERPPIGQPTARGERERTAQLFGPFD